MLGTDRRQVSGENEVKASCPEAFTNAPSKCLVLTSDEQLLLFGCAYFLFTCCSIPCSVFLGHRWNTGFSIRPWGEDTCHVFSAFCGLQPSDKREYVNAFKDVCNPPLQSVLSH